MSAEFKARVLVAEDEEFTLNLLREVLTSANFQVEAVTNVADAIAKIGGFDPHAVITDLNFGITGPSGADLLQYIEKEHPWVGKVVLTSHASPALAVPNGMAHPAGVTYLVKSELGSILELVAEVENSIANLAFEFVKHIVENNQILIIAMQGEILELEVINLDVNESYSWDRPQLESPKTYGKLLSPDWLAYEVRAMMPNEYCAPNCLR